MNGSKIPTWLVPAMVTIALALLTAIWGQIRVLDDRLEARMAAAEVRLRYLENNQAVLRSILLKPIAPQAAHVSQGDGQ